LLEQIVPHYYNYRLRKDFDFFWREVLRFIKEKAKGKVFKTPEFHYKWRDLFLSGSKRIKIVAFRDSSKTTFWSFIVPMFVAVSKPGSLIVLISSSLDQSVQNVGNIREFIEEFMPEMIGKTWQKKIIKLSNKSKIVAKSVKSNIRGIKNIKERPSLIICDDIIADNPIMSMEEYKKYFYEAILPSLSENGTMIVVGTPFTPDDLLSDLSGYDVITTPIVDEFGNSAWEDKFPKERIEEIKKSLPPISWCRNYEVRPIVDVGEIFKKEWLLSFNGSLRGEPSIRVMGVDPAIKKTQVQKTDSDYFAVSVVDYYYKKHKWVVVFQTHVRCGFNEQIELIKTLGKEYDVDYVVIESNFYQGALAQYLIRNTSLPIVRLEQRKDKIERISMLAPYFQNGQIVFEGGINKDFVVEYLGFPNKKIHDDMLDSLHIAVFYSKKRSGKRAEEVIVF